MVGVWWAVAQGQPTGIAVFRMLVMNDTALFEHLMATHAATLGQFAHRWGYRVDDVRSEISAAVWEACVAGTTDRLALHRKVESHCRQVARSQARSGALEAVACGRDAGSLLRWQSADRVGRLLGDANVSDEAFDDRVADRVAAEQTLDAVYADGVPPVLLAWGDPIRRRRLTASQMERARRLRKTLAIQLTSLETSNAA